MDQIVLGLALNPNLEWKRPREILQNLPPTYASPSLHENSLAVTDCKSLYDLATRTAQPNCQEFRTMLQARAIRDLLDEGVTLKWVHSGAQIADALIKLMNSSFLRQTLEQGKYQLFDQHQILKNRASERNRTKWLQQDQ